MFKALNQLTGEEIIILQFKWERQIDRLRSLALWDRLICPGCKQPVRIRAGLKKRRHFAHKHLENCPFQTSSPALLAARAVLYRWLAGKFGEAQVNVEEMPSGSLLPRPVDCWVTGPNCNFAYWIFDTRLAPHIRAGIHAELEKSGVAVTWVFNYAMLHQAEKRADRLYLTTTERQFMQGSVYDEPVQARLAGESKSLHYLDPDRERVTTYRGLQLIHAPQLHQGLALTTPLADLQVSDQTGEFIHPGEADLLQQFWREQAGRREFLKHASEILHPASQNPAVSGTAAAPQAPTLDSPFLARSEAVRTDSSQLGEAVCMYCGRKTSDWWYLNRSTGQCKCRECLRLGKS